MLDGLRQFIADIVSPAAQEDRAFAGNDYRLAATALLVHVLSLDGEPTAIEKRKLHSLIESRFGLDPGTADKLIASATRVEGEAVLEGLGGDPHVVRGDGTALLTQRVEDLRVEGCRNVVEQQ